jgi:hypothetical protein
MKISDLKDKTKIEEIDLKIIWDKAETKEMFGKMIKTVIVADADSEGGPTAYFDLIDKQTELFKFQDKIKVKDAYSKLMKNGKQFWITNPTHIEKI